MTTIAVLPAPRPAAERPDRTPATGSSRDGGFASTLEAAGRAERGAERAGTPDASDRAGATGPGSPSRTRGGPAAGTDRVDDAARRESASGAAGSGGSPDGPVTIAQVLRASAALLERHGRAGAGAADGVTPAPAEDGTPGGAAGPHPDGAGTSVGEDSPADVPGGVGAALGTRSGATVDSAATGAPSTTATAAAPGAGGADPTGADPTGAGTTAIGSTGTTGTAGTTATGAPGAASAGATPAPAAVAAATVAPATAPVGTAGPEDTALSVTGGVAAGSTGAGAAGVAVAPGAVPGAEGATPIQAGLVGSAGSTAAVASSPEPTPAPAPSAPAAAEPRALAEQLGARLSALRTAPQGEHVLTLRVDPESMGPVRVVARIGAEGVRIELLGVTDQAREALKAALPDLRRDLVAAGLTGELNLGHQSTGRGTGTDTGPGRGDGGASAPAGPPTGGPGAAGLGTEIADDTDHRPLDRLLGRLDLLV